MFNIGRAVSWNESDGRKRNRSFLVLELTKHSLDFFIFFFLCRYSPFFFTIL